VVAADGAVLSPRGRRATSIVFALPRGMRVDTAATTRSCRRTEALGAGCPEASRIGSGRIVYGVGGFLAPGGETEVAWSLAAYLGKPIQRGDVASVVLSAKLLAADSVKQLLVPVLGASVPSGGTATGRLVRRASGAYTFELRFAELPVQFAMRAPATATPTRLEFGLSAVRRIRQDFVRRIRVPTATGYEIQKIPDHRLVGHDLLRAPPHCRSAWPWELRVGSPGGVVRTTGELACLKTAFSA
jgi:hypothetical protein